MPRDAAIIKFVYCQRVVTTDQIRRKFFPTQHRTAVTRRLRKLCDRNFLNEIAVLRNGKAEKCLTPNQKGFEQVKHLWKIEIDNPLFKSESPDHDVRLAELILRIEKLKCFRSFYSENLLQSSSTLAEDPILSDFVKMQADGALVFKGPDEAQSVFAIELEISAKSLSRYKDKLASYYLSESVDGVFYVCSSQSIVNLLTEADAAVRSKRKSILHYSLEADALGQSTGIILSSSDIDRVVLK